MLDRRRFLGASAAVAASTASLTALSAADPDGSAKRAGAAEADLSTIGRTPHTQFAVNVEMWFNKLPFLDRLRRTAALGFPAIEYWNWRAPGKDVSAVAEVAEETGLQIAQFTAWGFSPGLNDPANHSRFVEEIEAGCETAKRLRCPMMTVVGGNDIPGVSQQQMHENIIVGLKRAAPIAEKHEVMLILEPMNIRVDHKGHCLYGSPDAVRICREVGSPMVKINWDLYHMQISEGDLCGRLKEGWEQVGYLQLADHPGRNEPGTGEIHYNRVLKQAYDLGYRGFVGLECRPKAGEEAAARAVAAADIW